MFRFGGGPICVPYDSNTEDDYSVSFGPLVVGTIVRGLHVAFYDGGTTGSMALHAGFTSSRVTSSAQILAAGKLFYLDRDGTVQFLTLDSSGRQGYVYIPVEGIVESNFQFVSIHLNNSGNPQTGYVGLDLEDGSAFKRRMDL